MFAVHFEPEFEYWVCVSWSGLPSCLLDAITKPIRTPGAAGRERLFTRLPRAMSNRARAAGARPTPNRSRSGFPLSKFAED
jgi:hypothetical protein